MAARLTIARALLLIGLFVGFDSWLMTVKHIGDQHYILPAHHRTGPDHAKFHAFREAVVDLGIIATLLLVMFGPGAFRTRQTWAIALILAVGYYAPFWIGAPFSSALAAPNWTAELIHILMAGCTLAALAVARSEFNN